MSMKSDCHPSFFFFTLHDLGLIVRSYIFFVRPGT